MKPVERVYLQRGVASGNRMSERYRDETSATLIGSVIEQSCSRDSDSSFEIQYSHDRLRELYGGQVPDIILDLVELAVGVYRVDRHIERTPILDESDSATRINNRTISIRFPVLTDAFASNRVADILSTLLSFMTRDVIKIETIRHESAVSVPLPDESAGEEFDVVSLFSEGLDSAAGVYENRTTGVNSCYLTMDYGAGLGDVYHTSTERLGIDPYVFTSRSSERSREFTSFSRGFLHWAFAAAVGVAVAADEIRSFETGVMARFAIVSEAWHTTRTVEPRAVVLFNELLSEILDCDLVLTNPFLDSTKREVVERIEDPRIAREAISCPHYGRQERFDLHNCGQCVPCIVRSLALLSGDFDIPIEELSVCDWGEIDFANQEFPSEAASQLANRNDAETFFLAINEIAYFARLLREEPPEEVVLEYPQLAEGEVYRLYGRFADEFNRAVQRLEKENPTAGVLLGE